MKRETAEERRQRFLATARASVSGAYATEEHSVIQAINSYLEIERIKNLVHERLEEWYSIYFPELRINNQSTYAKFVIEVGRNKKEANAEKLRGVVGEKAGEVESAIKKSIGREPSPDEYTAMRTLAESELALIEMEKKIDDYLAKSTKALMPNISHLVDYKIAAELLSRAGSLKRLGMMPASTIQLLGAEKALFKHLKYGSKPPKYGVLFKMQRIATAGKKDRGRIARVYATKISIAAKADAFTKRFIAEKLKADIEKAVARSRNESRLHSSF